ncbi:uncharacterized protein PHALS_13220 [Plasmopara halstedii]|uniref:Uncharacterized protein n=1 Tax=Plasmopara halstedii TaxID=4781 RepID=A0A0P1AQ41_PLAHL|nr:uncharacterized protein PHALS_13220 [Plasmopara halstedii]CEG42991.1 hypothetical protein PHALS_13220 [Plasmopara halstedii]|eukprot:XP_024579360.1 hypothetical protein PHALS_13220 [Plasmopara halstedii]
MSLGAEKETPDASMHDEQAHGALVARGAVTIAKFTNSTLQFGNSAMNTFMVHIG